MWSNLLNRPVWLQYIARVLLVFLLIAGCWVATITVTFPQGPQLNDKFIHIVVFFGFSLLADIAYSKTPFCLWKGVPLLAYGAFIEVLQYFTPFRMFSLQDLLADFVGIALYFLLVKVLWRRVVKLAK